MGGYAVSNGNGEYEVRNLPFGQYEVRVGARTGIGLVSRSATLSSGDAEKLIDFDLPTAGFVNGSVFDSSGDPIANATVRLMQGGITVHETSTHQDGSYSIIVLQSGLFDVGAGATDLVFPIIEGLNLGGGNQHVADFHPGSESLEGILTDESTGDPIEGATVLLSLSALGYGVASKPNEVTSSDGSFQFTGLAPGEYDIQFLIPGKATILETITIAEPQPACPKPTPWPHSPRSLAIDYRARCVRSSRDFRFRVDS